MADNKPFDPGTGGFNVDGELYTFDVGVTDGDGGSQGQWSGGDVSPDKTTRDISKPTRETLGKYLGRVTQGKEGVSSVPNRYPVDDRDQADIKLTNEKGYPTRTLGSDNTSKFVADVPSARSDDVLALDIKRGKNDDVAQDGNELLQRATEKTSPIKKYTSAVLTRNRFYSPDSPLRGVPQIKTGFALGSSQNGDVMSDARLAQVGAALSVRAGIELKSTSRGFDPSSTGAEVSAILPGIAQLGVARVDNILLTAKDVFEDLDNNIDNVDYIKPNSMSWGTLNNVNDQFSGLSAVGMIALSTALVAALEIVVSTLELLFSAGQSPKKKPTKDTVGRYALGSYYYGNTPKDNNSVLGVVSAVASLDLGRLLGIQPTTAPFTSALKKGLQAFFGLDDGTNSFTLIPSITKIADDPGFKAVVARTIIRSSITITDQVKKIHGNPINIGKQAVGLIDVLRSSKIISACNIFAQLGDALLSTPDTVVDNDSLGGTRLSYSDTLSDDVYGAVGKIRLKGSLKLAYAQDRTNSLLLLPKVAAQLSAAGRSLGVSNPSLSLGSGKDGLTTTNIGNNTGRIDPDIVAEHEKKLDAEYVPFYFHDLRTNEIVSFHAFLDVLSDSFNANYDQNQAWGRVDPVMTYQNTSRNISVGFMIAATSESDYDNMWLKINKLVTLMYPQYTAGKMITNNGNFTIRQPFSQMIAAAPMIRLRVGDVIKSNYSRFNLAKLFGLGDPNVIIDGSKIDPSDVSQQAIDNYNKSKLATALASPAGLTFIPTEGATYNLYEDNKLGQLSVGINILGGKDNSGVASSVFSQAANAFMIKAVKRLDSRNVVGEVQLNEDLSEVEAKKLLGAKFGTDPSTTLVGNVVGAQYVFPDASLRNTRKTDSKMYDKLIGVNANAMAKSVSDFMSVDANKGNAVARSFKSTGGKGLAGFITNMDFDWSPREGPWELGSDRKAPMIVKVRMSFNPIHDISPGLDSSGVNRAPVYPIGLSAPSVEKKGGNGFF